MILNNKVTYLNRRQFLKTFGTASFAGIFAGNSIAEDARAFPGITTDTGQTTITVDASAQGEPLSHVWSFFGFDECNYATTPAAGELMSTLVKYFPEQVYIRKHHLLNTGDGIPSLKWGSTNVYTEDGTGKPVYSWTILDGIMDAVTNSGCLPLVEIGFMPKALSSNPEPYQSEKFSKIGAGFSSPPQRLQEMGGTYPAVGCPF